MAVAASAAEGVVMAEKAALEAARAAWAVVQKAKDAAARAARGEEDRLRMLHMQGHLLQALPRLDSKSVRFGGLRQLDVSGNKLTLQALQAADVAALRLTHLNVSHNDIAKLPPLVEMLRNMPSIQVLSIDANPCFPLTQFQRPEDGQPARLAQIRANSAAAPTDIAPDSLVTDASSRQRRKLFAMWPALIQLGAHLRILNHIPVGVSERLDAGHPRTALPKPLEEQRTLLTLEKYGLLHGTSGTTVALPRCGLRGDGQFPFASFLSLSPTANIVTGEGCGFRRVRVLNLAGNQLQRLVPAELHRNMPVLHTLDLRNNSFADAEELAAALGAIHTLQHLCIANAFDPAASRLNENTDLNVFSGSLQNPEVLMARLRMVAVMDGQYNPSAFTDDQLDAAAYLYDLSGGSVSGNNLEHVDLSNCERLRTEAHFGIALACIEMVGNVRKVSFTDAGFVHKVRMYRHYVIERLYDRGLEMVDGQPVTGDQIENACTYVEKHGQVYADLKRIKGHAAASGQFEKASEKTAMRVTGGQTGGNTFFQSKMNAGGGAVGEVGGAAGGLEGAGALAKGVGAGAAGAIGALAANASGSFLTKWELAIGYLQIYGSVIRVSFNVDVPNLREYYPQFFFDFNKIFAFIPNFLVDVDLTSVLGLVPGAVYVYGRFVVFAVWALALLRAYRKANAADMATWRKAYVEPVGWRQTKTSLWCRFFSLILLATALSFIAPLANDLASGTAADSGDYEVNQALTLLIVLAGMIVCCMCSWCCVIRSFRRRHRKDPSKAMRSFLRNKRRILRLVLFLITVSYIPITTEMLGQFANQYNAEVLAESGCKEVDGDGVRCCLKAFPTLPCVTSPNFAITPLQIAALPILLIFTLGVPLFFARLVHKGAQEVDRAGYVNHQRAITMEMEQHQEELKIQRQRLKEDKSAASGGGGGAVADADSKAAAEEGGDAVGALGGGGAEVDAEMGEGALASMAPAERIKARKALIKERKKEVKRCKKELGALWQREVKANPKSQTYLYAPFKRKGRFQKVIQIVFRVMLITTAALVPIGTQQWAAGYAVSGVLGASSLAEIFGAAFDDPSENLLATYFGIANFFNMLLTIAIGNSGPDGGTTLAGVLVLVNLLAFVLILIAVSAQLRKACKRCCGGKKKGDEGKGKGKAGAGKGKAGLAVNPKSASVAPMDAATSAPPAGGGAEAKA